MVVGESHDILLLLSWCKSYFRNISSFNNYEHSDYYSIDKFNEKCITDENYLNIIHCNIRSQYADYDEFLVLLRVFHVKFWHFMFLRELADGRH